MHRTALQWPRLLGGFLVISFIILFLQGCANLQQSMGEKPALATTLCGAGGALAGAAAGAALSKNNPSLGAIVGALVGGVAAGATCFTIAKANSTQIRDYGQTQRNVGYRPTQGTLVRVDRLDIEPASIAPGQEFSWRSEYVVMAPDPNADLKVVETRILSAYNDKKREWNEVGRIPTTITAKPGTRQDEAKMTMPSTTASKYQVTFQVEHNNVVNQQSREIVVATRPASRTINMYHLVSEGVGEASRGATNR